MNIRYSKKSFLYTVCRFFRQALFGAPSALRLSRKKTGIPRLMGRAAFFALALPLLLATDVAAQEAEPFGFGVNGEPAPSTTHPGEEQSQSPWGPLINVQSGVVPAHQTGAALPGSPMPRDNTVNVWHAPKPAAPQEETKPEDVWDLVASKVTGYNTSKILEAEGNVELHRGNEYLKADYARYYAATGWVYLKGNVQVFFGKDRLSAEEAEFDIANKVGWLKNGTVFMEGPHAYFSGKRINKHWGDMYSFREAKVTTCDGDVPAWSMNADEAIVEIDGYARLWNTSFAVKDQPIVYSPYMVLPAKKDRQTGFLVPEAGYSSENGAMFNLPLFIAVDESQNLTLNTDIMTKRGALMGAEYWARPDTNDELWLRGDVLWDAETSDRRTTSGLYRTNEQRFWLRGMYDGSITNSRWRIKANLDYVSDQDFLREFRNRPGMFEENNDTLLDLFGRELNPWSSNRVSEAQIFREWERVSFYAGMRYEQDPALGHGNAPYSSDTIAQKLPEFNMYLNKGRIFDQLPLEISAEAQAVNFYRPYGATGQRYDIYPRISLPINTKYFSLEPAFGFRQTQYETSSTERISYMLSGREVSLDGSNKKTSRSLPEFEITAFTELARIYALNEELAASLENVGKSRWSAMRHSIQPRVNYYKVADQNQHDLPYYDYIDRIAMRDEITYSLTNLFSVKRESVAVDAEGNPVKQASYLDFLRFTLEHGFDFDEKRRTDYKNEYPTRPFMDLLADLELNPGEYISLRSRAWFSSYNGEITRQNHSISFNLPGWGSLRTALDFRNEPDEYWRQRKYLDERQAYLLHQGILSRNDVRWGRYQNKVNMLHNVLHFTALHPFRLTLDHWYNLDKRRPMEYDLTLDYIHQCFILSGKLYWDSDDTGFGLSVSLPGFWN
ncbi:MAG: LPS-assembly protein LptD [Desulfovibrionaceae bacterium]|nr:LPS-assembly protein LptD [Desulfovibrionaceae bacterium]